MTSYTQKTWVDDPTGGTPITAFDLNHIEAGVAAANNIGWTAYAGGTSIDITNFGGGSSTSFWRYKQLNGLIFVQGAVVLGSGGGCYGATSFALPATADLSYSNTPIGRVLLFDWSAGAYYDGALILSSNSAQIQAWNSSGTYPVSTSLGGGVPFTWAANDRISVEMMYSPT